MGLTQAAEQAYLATVRTQNIRQVSVAAVTPASGAPGAWSVAIANAAVAEDYWLIGASFDTPSAGAVFDYDFATPAAGTTVIVTGLHLEVATDAGWYPPVNLLVPRLIPVSATNGLAIRQQTASGQTLNVVATYLTGLGT
jgi:hypothetical protein